MAEIRWINKNKSCIEIFLVPILQTDQRLINKNKSCIEIAVAAGTGRVYAD